MSNDYKIYKFAEFELDEEEEILFKDKKNVALTSTEYRILLLLLQRRGKSISTADLFEEIWGLDSEAQESNVSAHIKGIRNKFGEPNREQFIKTEKNKKGYKFIFGPVIEAKKQETPFVNEALGQTPREASNFERVEETSSHHPPALAEGQSEAQSFTKLQLSLAVCGMVAAYIFFDFARRLWVCAADECFEQTVFITLATVFYGVLVGIGVLLECAYDFDRYGWNAAKMIPSIVFVSTGAMFAALTVAGNSLHDNGIHAFWKGLLFLVTGAIISCVLAAFVLPNAPVTAARFQTQSAIGAFCKNVLIYFLPLYTVFGLLIFCFVFGPSELTKSVAFPIALAVIWMIFFVFSYLSTNYLSDNLLTEKGGVKYKYHGLFSLLLHLRMIFCFITALGSIIWYFFRALSHTASGN